MVSSSIEFRRPGVEVTEVPLPRDAGSVNNGQARAVITGYLDRGPILPTNVTSWAQFQSLYGSWTGVEANDRTVDAVYSYFSNVSANASQLVVLRLTGASAVAAHAHAVDSNDAVVFTATAASPGAWGNKIRLSISEGYGGQTVSGLNTVFNVQVARVVTVGSDEVVVGTPERFYNLSVSDQDRSYFVSVINSSSRLITVEHDPTAKTSKLQPEADESLALASGADGTITTLAVDDKMPLLDPVESPLAIYLASCGSDGDPVEADTKKVIEYAANRGDSFVIVDTPRLNGVSDDAADVITAVSSLSITSPFAAVYFPWLVVADPTKNVSGLRKVIPPGGAVLGAYATTDAAYGPWRSPAGVSTVIRNAISVDQVLSETALSTLNSATLPVNVLRPISGSGICIMGARTLDPTNADKYVAIRRSLSYITANLKRISETALFEPNGPDLWARLTAQMNDWLGRYYQQGALRGAREPEAFKVIIDATNNTAATIAAGEVHIEVGVAVEFPAEFIYIRLTQQQGSIGA